MSSLGTDAVVLPPADVLSGNQEQSVDLGNLPRSPSRIARQKWPVLKAAR